MAKSQRIPHNAVVVERYEELDSFTRAFAAGHLRFLMVVGPAGTGKSQAMRNAVAGRAAWVDGNATAFGVYCAAFKHQDSRSFSMMSMPCIETPMGFGCSSSYASLKPHVCWAGTPTLSIWSDEGFPRTFTTSSPVAIIANRWSTMNADVAALEDRGHMIVFDPPPVEIHRQAAIWFHDQEVFDFISEHLHLITNHSFRTYLLALELKKAQMDWKRTILSRFLSGPLLLVAQLKADPEFKSESERVRAFREGGGGGRRPISNMPSNSARQPRPRQWSRREKLSFPSQR